MRPTMAMRSNLLCLSVLQMLVMAIAFPNRVDHTKYHSYDEAEHILRELLKPPFRDHLLEVSSLARGTYENRRVDLLTLHNPSRNPTLGPKQRKPIIMIEAGQHGNEWLAPASTIYFVEKVLHGGARGTVDAKLMLDKFDWIIIPMSNPDGYEFTRSAPKNRNWNKNRHVMGQCTGVDINQNFFSSFYASNTLTEHICNHPNYRGLKQFSEVETLHTANVFLYHKKDVVAYVNVRALGQAIAAAPLSSTITDIRTLINNRNIHKDSEKFIDETVRLAKQMKQCIQNETGLNFDAELGMNLQHPTVYDWPTAPDYVVSVKHQMHAFQLFLGPTHGDHRGFDMPASEIVSQGEALYAAMLALAKQIDLNKFDYML